MPWGVAAAAAASIGGSVAGGMLSGSGSKKQQGLMREQWLYQKDQDERTRRNLQPYLDFGKDQLNSLGTFLTDKNPSNYIDPGYAFRLKSGTNAIQNSAAANGMLQSGDTLRALTEYGQDMGSQEYGNAFQRYLQEGGFRQGLAGMGQNAALGLGSLGNQGAVNMANIAANTDAGGQDRAMANSASFSGGALAGLFGQLANLQSGGKVGPSSGAGNYFSNIFNKQQAPHPNQWFGPKP